MNRYFQYGKKIVNRLPWHEMIRFGIGGLSSMAVNLFFYILLENFIIFWLANIVATFITWVYSYFVNKFFVFKVKKRSRLEMYKFAIQQLSLLGVATLLLKLLVDFCGLNKTLSWLLVAGLMALLNYLGMKFLVWQKKNSK